MTHNRCHKTAAYTLILLYFLNKITALAPLHYVRNVREFRSQRRVTVGCIVTFIVLIFCAPLLFHANVALYAKSGVELDSIMHLIALAAAGSEVVLASLLIAIQLWQRHQLIDLLNQLLRLQRQLFLCRSSHNMAQLFSIALFWLKLSGAIYGAFSDLPFVLIHAHEIGILKTILALLTLCVQKIPAIFALDMFAIMLWLAAQTHYLEQLVIAIGTGPFRRKKSEIEKFVAFECGLLRIMDAFMRTFQWAIFLILFQNIWILLANLYALLDLYVVLNYLEWINVVNCTVLFVDMYALIYAAQQCVDGAQRLNWAFLNLEAQHLGFKKMPRGLTRLSQIIPLQLDFSVLGMFSLRHEFILFIVSYSVNFVVIILQFAMEKYSNK